MKKSLFVLAAISSVSVAVFAESWGTSRATGQNALAWGENNVASGVNSTANGNNSRASGRNSTAEGEYSEASGYASTASGFRVKATGVASTATGQYTLSQARGEFVTGSFNVRFPEINGNLIDDNDPIFVVGNGYISGGIETIYSNALTVFRDGTTTIDGNLVVNGNIASTSDERLKSNIEPFLRSDDVIMALEPVSYTLDNDDDQKTQIGFIAQDVEEILPEVINHSFLLDDYKSIDYSKLTVILVGAVQTIKNENELLKNENALLKKESELLKDAVCELNNQAKICI